MSNRAANKIVALAGGVGGAKLVYGLAHITPPEGLTVIVNTGDDFEHLGLHIAPDLDTVMYTLAGVANPATGWGVKDESWNMMAALTRYGGPTWFQLGDRDLATHLLRTKWLREGYPYNWVTKELCTRLGIRQTVLPMSETPIRSMIVTNEGELALQEYFVKRKWAPVVRAIRFEGIEEASPSREIISAIREADVIVFCPSNPLISLDPILSIPTLRRIIAASRAPKVGVSPIVGGKAIKGPAAKMMQELGLEPSPAGVARRFQDLLTAFVIDHTDEAYQDTLTEMGLRTLVTATLMQTSADKVRLADEVLNFVRKL